LPSPEELFIIGMLTVVLVELFRIERELGKIKGELKWLRRSGGEGLKRPSEE